MTTKDFQTFIDLSVNTSNNYLHVHSSTKPSRWQLRIARNNGIIIETRKRDKRWFEIDFIK